MNELPNELITGTAGELLVQLRLLQYGVQAAAPLKDTGNDLIAVRGDAFRAVQVKTTGSPGKPWSRDGLQERQFHILALVRLAGNASGYDLEESEVYLVPHDDMPVNGWRELELEKYVLSRDLVDALFDGRTVDSGPAEAVV